ncbi:MAG: hypothetical protein M3N12_08275, partial [Verrucomicrobiota bacterium]|nr:hypothetical protein [Verrucomicrobiota bacterium]
MSLPISSKEESIPNEESRSADTFDYLALEALLRRFRPLGNVRYPLTLAFLSTVLTFAFGFCAYLVIQNKIPPEGWLGIWNRWDAWHYLNVAEHGYSGEAGGEQRYMIVFLPLYPLSIYISHFLIRNWHV